MKSDSACLPSVVSVGVLLPLSHLHVPHGPGRASVVLLSHSTVGPRLHELLSSFRSRSQQRVETVKVSSRQQKSGAGVCTPFRAPPTFPHASKRVLVGLVGPHSAHHLGSPHPGLVALGVGGHGVPPGKRRVSAFSKRVLQVNTAPNRGREALD